MTGLDSGLRYDITTLQHDRGADYPRALPRATPATQLGAARHDHTLLKRESPARWRPCPG